MLWSSAQEFVPNTHQGTVGLSVLFALVTLLTGCGAPGSNDDRASRDVSEWAGLIIDAGAWPERQDLSIDPNFSFNAESDSSESPLFQIRAVLPRPDGGAYIANSGLHQIIAIDEGGELLWKAGREGDGPTEFRSLGLLQAWQGDTIAAIDHQKSTISFWTEDGTFVRALSVGEELVPRLPDSLPVAFTWPAGPEGIMVDGQVVVRGPEYVVAEGSMGLRRARTPISIVDTGGLITTQFELPGPWMYELSRPSPLAALMTPLTIFTSVAVGSHSIAWAHPDSFQIFVMPPDSVPIIIRFDELPDPLTAGNRREFRNQWRPWFPVDAEVPFASEHFPAFDRIFFGQDGSIWVQRFGWSPEDGRRVPEEWIRSAWDGSSVDRFNAPARVEVLGATARFAYGVHRDKNDVEQLVRLVVP